MRSPLDPSSRLLAAVASFWLVMPAATGAALDAAQDTTHDVVVVGAGAAGLAAAHALVTLGFDVLVLEALDRTGGRVWNTKDIDPGFATYEQALGGSYVQGTNNNPFYDALVARYGADEFEGMFSDNANGRSIYEATWNDEVQVQHYPGEIDPEIYDYWDFYSHVYSASDSDNLHDASTSYEQDLAEHAGVSPSDDTYHLFASYGANYQARMGDMAILDFARQDQLWEYSGGSVQFRTKSWATALEDEFSNDLIAGNHILLNSRVTEINTAGSQPYALVGATGAKHFAGAIIVTVSAGVMNAAPSDAGYIDFVPDLPAAKVAAFRSLNMYPGDGGTAVLLKWDFAWRWQKGSEWYVNDGPAGNCWLDALHKAIPNKEKVIWKCLVHPDDYVREGMAVMTDQEIMDAVAEDFAEGFGSLSLSNLVDSMIFRTTDHPSFYGSYSSPGFGSYPDTGHSARVEAGLPEGSTACHKLYFAGEANNDIGAALVHAAVEQGWRAAGEVDVDISPGFCAVPEPSALMQATAACFSLLALRIRRRRR